MNPPLLTLADWHAAFESGAADPVSLLESGLRRAREAGNRAVFIRLTETRARPAAEAAAARLRAGKRLGALDGIAVSWKDLFDQAGETTRAGSLTTADNPPAAQDAAVVSLLESVGAVSIGRTNLTEFALSGLGLNPHFGTPANVWSAAEPLAPGGSSCGAAVSVAAGIVPYAVGTDTSGSVRIPAALNGLAGFKPTSARLPRIGVWTLSPTLDSIGPLAHTAADICTVMQAFHIDSASCSDRHFKAVVPEGLFTEDAEPQILAAFEQSIARLAQAGVNITRKPLRALQRLETLFDEYGTLVGIEAWQLHQNAPLQTGIMDERVAQRLQSNRIYPLHHLFELLTWRTRLQKQLAEELQGALLLLPTTAIDAPPLARLENDREFFAEANRKILRNTMAGSFLDMPGFTVPTGLNRNGLPAALLVSAASGRDEYVLHAGKTFAGLLTGDAALNRRRFE